MEQYELCTRNECKQRTSNGIKMNGIRNEKNEWNLNHRIKVRRIIISVSFFFSRSIPKFYGRENGGFGRDRQQMREKMNEQDEFLLLMFG